MSTQQRGEKEASRPASAESALIHLSLVKALSFVTTNLASRSYSHGLAERLSLQGVKKRVSLACHQRLSQTLRPILGDRDLAGRRSRPSVRKLGFDQSDGQN
jgi:hypothetical protein